MGKMTAEDRYLKLLQLRAERLGVSLRDAENVGASDNLFLQATESVAKRLGKSPEEILREDFQRLEASAYPTDDCLTPAEIEDLVGAGASLVEIADQAIGADSGLSIGNAPLPAARLAHLRNCSGCRLLLAACRPKQALLDEFNRHVEVAPEASSKINATWNLNSPKARRRPIIFAEGALAGVFATLAVCVILLGPLYGVSYKLVEPMAEAVKGFRTAATGPDMSVQKLGLAAALARSVDWDANRLYQKGDIVYVSGLGSAGGDTIPLVVTNPRVFNLAKDEITKDWKQGVDLRIAAREIGLQPLTGEKKGALTASDLAPTMQPISR